MTDGERTSELSEPGDADLQQSNPSPVSADTLPEIATTPTAEPVEIEGDPRLRPFPAGTLTRVLFGQDYDGGTRRG